MNKDKQKEYVKFLRALGSEERMSILEDIEQNGEISASDVENKFFMEQSTASHHLNILKRANILFSRRAGRHIYYNINESHLDNFYKEFTKNLREKQVQRMKNSEK